MKARISKTKSANKPNQQTGFFVPILMGLALTVGFYALIAVGLLNTPYVQRYFCSHPLEYVTTALFLVGMTILGMKLGPSLRGEIRLRGAIGRTQRRRRFGRRHRSTGRHLVAATFRHVANHLAREEMERRGYFPGGSKIRHRARRSSQTSCRTCQRTFERQLFAGPDNHVGRSDPGLSGYGRSSITIAIANVTPEQLGHITWRSHRWTGRRVRHHRACTGPLHRPGLRDIPRGTVRTPGARAS